MKKLTSLLLAFSLLTACGTPKVDLKEEMGNQPEINVSWEGEEKAASVLGDFCNGAFCMDNAEPDWATLTYTPFINGTPYEISVNSTKTIKELSVSLKNETGHTVQNNIPKTDNGDHTFTVTESFLHTGKLSLSVKVTFEEGGYGQTFFPLDIK
jgi:hypothetical protein